jgi:hypothetical protein
MNIEELKLVLETVSVVADDTKSVAIWYIILNYGASFVLHLVALVGLIGAAITITRYIVNCNEWAKIGARLSHSWGGYSSSVYSNPNDYETVNAIDSCIVASKEHKK